MAERPPPLNRNLLTLALWLLILSVFSQPAVSTESEGEITFDEISSTPSHLNYNQLALLAEQESAQAKSDQAKWDADIKAGSYFLQGGRLSKARILGLDCLTRATQMKDAQRECRAMLLLGGSFRSKGNEGKAQMYFQKALEKSELGGNTADLICALNDVAVGYVKSDSFELAIPLYQRALALARTRDEAWQEIAITNNLANIYRRNGNRDKALEVFNEALQRSEKSGHLAVQSVLHRNIGALFLSRRELSECLDHLQRSVSLSRQQGDSRQLASALMYLARALILVADKPGALKAINEAETLIRSLEKPLDLMIRLYEAKGLVLENAGDYAEALKMQKQMHRYYLTAQSNVQTSELRELNIRYETDRRKQELQKLQSEQALKAIEQTAAQDRVYLLTIGLCGSLMFGAFSLFLFRAKLKAERSELAVTMDARQVAESSAGLKTRLLRMAAHDLRNPLTVIITGGDLIKLLRTDPEKVAQYATMTIDAANYMNSLLESLLTQAANDDGVLKVQPIPTDMKEHVKEIVAYLHVSLQRKQQEISISQESEAMNKAMADPIRIWQVLENLISNASKFSPAGSSITVKLACMDGMLACGVTDQGPGISKTEMSLLFKPFAKGKAKPTGGERSTGLGLSMAKEIMDLHAGRIWIESTLGKGSTFWISLPMAKSE